MDIDKIAEIDRLIEHLENVSADLQDLYLNIDKYDRYSASTKIATNAGLVKGVAQRLNEIRG